jgi:uncharacterized cysteine cluster protein YcgN (CxxCxxCC family)
MTPIEWEALCRKCGKCCYHKYWKEDGTLGFASTHCKYFNIYSKRCMTYSTRFKVAPNCSPVTMETIPKLKGCLAPDCPYVLYVTNLNKEVKE